MTEPLLNVGRVGRVFRNAFLSRGANLFGWPFVRDYLAMAWKTSQRWGDAGPARPQIRSAASSNFHWWVILVS